MQGEGTAALEEELRSTKRQTQVVADTLRTTLERLEEEMARGNQLEDALKRMDQRLTQRDRCADVLLHSSFGAPPLLDKTDIASLPGCTPENVGSLHVL